MKTPARRDEGEEIIRYMDQIRKRMPEVFENVDTQELARIIIEDLADYLGPLNTIRKAGMLAIVMTLMYDMGRAASMSTNPKEKRKMTRVFVDERPKWVAKRK